MPTDTNRTEADTAGQHLATCATELVAVINVFLEAEANARDLDEARYGPELDAAQEAADKAVEQAGERLSEWMRATREAVHEYRERLARLNAGAPS